MMTKACYNAVVQLENAEQIDLSKVVEEVTLLEYEYDEVVTRMIASMLSNERLSDLYNVFRDEVERRN